MRIKFCKIFTGNIKLIITVYLLKNFTNSKSSPFKRILCDRIKFKLSVQCVIVVQWQWGPILEIIFITNYEAKTENPMKIAAL